MTSLPLSRVTGAVRAPEPRMVGCSRCVLRKRCGGVDGQFDFFGCFQACSGNSACAESGWTCLCRPKEWADRWGEVGTAPMVPGRMGPLRPLVGALPEYVPLIQHRSRNRTEPFSGSVVALSTFTILSGHETGYAPRAKTPQDLRVLFGLRRDAKIILVSVSQDAALERYWSWRRGQGTPELLARLGVMGMTVPNFSFFLDAPRPHTEWNRERMRLTAMELSAAGIPVILHLNAITRSDWAYWRLQLDAQPDMVFVAKEFQTGHASPEKAVHALEDMARLQDGLHGRRLHPLLIGGGRHLVRARGMFDSCTVIDSVPFMKTMHRRKYTPERGLRARWRSIATAKGEPLDELLEHNVASYSQTFVNRGALPPHNEDGQVLLKNTPRTAA